MHQIRALNSTQHCCHFTPARFGMTIPSPGSTFQASNHSQ